MKNSASFYHKFTNVYV